MISGPPRSGKTTLAKKILGIDSYGKIARGFFTEEFKKEGVRVGFRIVTVPEGRRAIFSKKGLPSSYRVGRYGVNLEVLEELGCGAIISQGSDEKKLVVVDEIGKMELFSEKFRIVLMDVLNSRVKVLATIMKHPNAFAESIKIRPDVMLLSLTRDNFQQVFQKALNWLDKRYKFCL